MGEEEEGGDSEGGRGHHKKQEKRKEASRGGSSEVQKGRSEEVIGSILVLHAQNGLWSACNQSVGVDVLSRGSTNSATTCAVPSFAFALEWRPQSIGSACAS